MITPSSRYAETETAEWTWPDGRKVRYLRRRLPPATPPPVTDEHVLIQGERLDHLAFRYLGDPELFWRICDANAALLPRELTAVPGRRLRIPVGDEP